MITGAIVTAAFLTGFAFGWFGKRQVQARAEARRILAVRRELHDADRMSLPHQTARGTARQYPIRFTSGPVSGPKRES